MYSCIDSLIWIVSCSWSNSIILQLKVVAEKSATIFGDLPDCLCDTFTLILNVCSTDNGTQWSNTEYLGKLIFTKPQQTTAQRKPSAYVPGTYSTFCNQIVGLHFMQLYILKPLLHFHLYLRENV